MSDKTDILTDNYTKITVVKKENREVVAEIRMCLQLRVNGIMLQ